MERMDVLVSCNKDRITVSSSTRRISQEQGLDIQDANAYIKVVDGESVACDLISRIQSFQN